VPILKDEKDKDEPAWRRWFTVMDQDYLKNRATGVLRQIKKTLDGGASYHKVRIWPKERNHEFINGLQAELERAGYCVKYLSNALYVFAQPVSSL